MHKEPFILVHNIHNIAICIIYELTVNVNIIITITESEDVKYSSHPNLMELSSYMSETSKCH